MKVHDCCTLAQRHTGLIAAMRRNQDLAIVLLTDATSLHCPPPSLRGPFRGFRATFEQAVGLALLPAKDAHELLQLLNRPFPSDPNAMSSKAALIQHLYGIDILSPTDAHGLVTKASLEDCTTPHLNLIGLHYNTPDHMKRADLIQFILKNHDKSRQEDDQIRRNVASVSKKRKVNHQPISLKQLEEMKNLNDHDMTTLLKTGSEPDFAKLYIANYGLQDRFNSALYSCFKFQNASGPMQMLTWFVLITYILNARSIYAEIHHDPKDDMSQPCHNASFALSLATQIVRKYTQVPINGNEKFVIDDQNLLRISSESDVVRLQANKRNSHPKITHHTSKITSDE